MRLEVTDFLIPLRYRPALAAAQMPAFCPKHATMAPLRDSEAAVRRTVICSRAVARVREGAGGTRPLRRVDRADGDRHVSVHLTIRTLPDWQILRLLSEYRLSHFGYAAGPSEKRSTC